MPYLPLLKNFWVSYPCVGHVRMNTTTSMPLWTLQTYNKRPLSFTRHHQRCSRPQQKLTGNNIHNTNTTRSIFDLTTQLRRTLQLLAQVCYFECADCKM